MDRSIIMRALEERRVLQLIYADGGPRTIQPHAILRKSNGTELLEAYQVEGVSERGSEHGWRHFDLARIEHVTLEPTYFEPRRDFRPVSGQHGVLVAQVRTGAAADV